MSTKYGQFSLEELKSELRKRQARISGRKKELIERLEAYDRNANFGQENVTDSNVYHMVLPDMDLHSGKTITKVEMSEISRYLGTYDKKLDPTCINLYKEKYLRYIRVCSTNEFEYIHSCCRAEMKKSVTYQIDVCIDRKLGHINEAQCECAAGMGPQAHCKHICAVLYACHIFGKTGDVTVEETCTQRLMTFHHVRKFNGSPLKACNLNISGADALTEVKFDPRPQVYRNQPAYNSYFQNTCLNFKGISSMPIFHIFTPANAKALAHDHDYLELTPEDNFLKQINVTEISSEAIVQVENETRGQRKNPLWREERLNRIQSSNFGRICKATDKTNFPKLAKDLQTYKDIRTPSILHGQKFEKIALDRYTNDNNCTITECGIFVSQESPYLGASPDGIVDKDLLVEVKCPFSIKDEIISHQNLLYLTEQTELDKQHDYYYQIQGQLYCAERKFCDLVIYTLKDIKYIRVVRDNVFISNMLNKLKKFNELCFIVKFGKKMHLFKNLK